jgi:CRP-like cAMP-binding protein
MRPTNKSYRAGTFLFHENDRSRELYIIQSGKIRIYRNIGGREIEIGIMGKGAVLGEMSLIDGRPRSASAKVLEPCTVTLIDLDTFETKIRGVPSWFLTIIRMVSTKIRSAHTHLERIQLDQRGINAILAIQYFLYHSTADSPQHKSGKIDTAKLQAQIPMLLAISSDRMIYIIDFLEKQKFITITGTSLECPDMERLSEYCTFLRYFVRKSFEKLHIPAEPINKILQEMQRSLRITAAEEKQITMSGEEFHIIVTAVGCTESEESLLEELQRIDVCNVKKPSGKENSSGDSVLYINCAIFYMHYLSLTYREIIPKP